MIRALKYLPSQEGFLGLDADASDPAKARAVVIPFGLEASVTYGGGTRLGPASILSASHQVELFDDELWCEAYKEYGVATVEEPLIPASLSDALDVLEALVGEILAQHRFPCVLGGEHALTAGAIRPFAKRYRDLVILQFDAHADLRDGYAGEHYSHAAAMRRCLDFPIELVGLGIRNISQEESEFLEANSSRVRLHWARKKRDWDLEEIVAPLRGRPVYVTFDVDGFDASLIPATGTPEPGGLFWDDVMPVLQRVAEEATIVGADVTELAPRPELAACDFIAAKLVYKLLNYALVPKAFRDRAGNSAAPC